MNEKLRDFLLLPPSFALIGALLAAPHIVHALDDRITVATVAEIAQGNLTSRHVTVTARVLADRALRRVITRNRQNRPLVSFFIPIADVGGEPGPTLVVVETYRDELLDAAAHPDVPLRLEGRVRDVLWEGLDDDAKKDLATQHPLSPGVKLVQLHGIGDVDDKWGAFAAPLGGLVFGLLTAAGGRRKKSPAAGTAG